MIEGILYLWQICLLMMLTFLALRFVYLIKKMNRLVMKYQDEYAAMFSIVEKNKHCADCANFVDESIFIEDELKIE